MKHPTNYLGRTKSKSRTASRCFRPALEPLESRYAPSCSFNASTHVLTGTGNDAAEMRISGATTSLYCNSTFIANTGSTNVTLTYNGGSGVNSLLLNDSAFSGGDDYHIFPSEMDIASIGFQGKVNANVQTLSLKTGAGGDSITQGTSFVSGMLFSFPKVVVDGGGGSNTFTADDSGQGSFLFGVDYTVSASQVTTSQVGLAVTYSNIQDLTLKASKGDDNITITGTGNKLFSSPHVTVDPTAGVDALTADDSGNAAGDTYTVSNKQITASGAVIGYSGMGFVTLKSGSSNDAVTVANAGNTFGSIPDFIINAGGGTSNTLTVNDSGETGDISYDISESELSLANSLVTYSGVQKLTLLTGSGSDDFYVSGSNHALDLMPHVSISPGAGTNTLTVDDSGKVGGDTIQVSGGQVSLPNSQGVVVDSTFMSTLTLLTGSGPDSVIVIGSTVGPPFSPSRPSTFS
jgi:hypothetical protein